MLLFLFHAVRRPASWPACSGFSGASMSGPGLHPRSASLRSPPFASPKQRADKTARSLPGQSLRFYRETSAGSDRASTRRLTHPLARFASRFGQRHPKKPPPHANNGVYRVFRVSNKHNYDYGSRSARRFGHQSAEGRCEDDGVMDAAFHVAASLSACGVLTERSERQARVRAASASKPQNDE